MRAGLTKTLYFSDKQVEWIEELVKLTGDAQSKIVRDAMELYALSLKAKKEK